MKLLLRITFYTTTIAIVSFLIVSIVIIRYTAKSYRNADGAIVLGAAAWDGEPSPVFAARIDHAIDLYRAGTVNTLYFTGGSSDTAQLSESETARNYALSLGVVPSDIQIENTSQTTHQNLAAILPLLDKSESYVIITDPLHEYRAVTMARAMGIDAYPSPTPYTMFVSRATTIPFLLRETFFVFVYWVVGI